MMKIKNLFICILMLFSIFACEKEIIEDSTLLQIENEFSELDKLKIDFAQVLANSFSDENTRKFIYNQFKNFKNKEYEFLLIEEQYKYVSPDVSFRDILIENETIEIKEKYKKPLIDQLISKIPLTTLRMPQSEGLSFEDWKGDIISIVVKGENDKILKFSGEQLNERSSEIDNKPFIGITESEVHYLIDNNFKTFQDIDIHEMMTTVDDLEMIEGAIPGVFISQYIINNKPFNLVHHDKLVKIYNDFVTDDPSEIGRANGNIQSRNYCYRDSEPYDEHLVNFKINDWGVYQNIKNQWLESKFVFHADVVYLVRSSLSNEVSIGTKKLVTTSYKKGDLLDCSGSSPCSGLYKSVYYRVWTDWDNSTFGDPYLISWAEVDNGSTTTKESSGLTAGFEVDGGTTSSSKTIDITRVGDKIVSLGSQNVFYCDNIYNGDNTGSITFNCD